MIPHYQPSNGYVADVIPFYWEGVYHAFYLRRREGRGTPYSHVSSTDLVHWEEWPDVIETGEPGEPDHGNCFTGSVIEKDGTFYLFYTGFTPDNPPLPRETICLATSTDLRHWTKDPNNPILLSDERWYERDDWRDPFVYWNPEDNCYWMLLCARDKTAYTTRGGCIGLATSPDLQTWTVRPPLWSPSLVYAPECPDLFEAHGLQFLLFSNMETRYRAFTEWGARKTYAPPTDSLDTPRFYAAKAFHNGDRHLLAGWVSSNKDETDAGAWEWGGTMGIVRELVTTPDGEMTVRVPDEVRAAYSKTLFDEQNVRDFETRAGEWTQRGNRLYSDSAEGLALTRLQNVPADFRLSLDLTLTGKRVAGSVLLRLSDKLDGGYQLVLEPMRQRVILRKWDTWGDAPPIQDRGMFFGRNTPIHLDIYVNGSILEAFFDNRVALTSRIYDFKQGDIALCVTHGEALVENVRLAVVG